MFQVFIEVKLLKLKTLNWKHFFSAGDRIEHIIIFYAYNKYKRKTSKL